MEQRLGTEARQVLVQVQIAAQYQEQKTAQLKQAEPAVKLSVSPATQRRRDAAMLWFDKEREQARKAGGASRQVRRLLVRFYELLDQVFHWRDDRFAPEGDSVALRWLERGVVSEFTYMADGAIARPPDIDRIRGKVGEKIEQRLLGLDDRFHAGKKGKHRDNFYRDDVAMPLAIGQAQLLREEIARLTNTRPQDIAIFGNSTTALQFGTAASGMYVSRGEPKHLCYADDGYWGSIPACVLLGHDPNNVTRRDEHLTHPNFNTIARALRTGEEELAQIIGLHGLGLFSIFGATTEQARENVRKVLMPQRPDGVLVPWGSRHTGLQHDIEALIDAMKDPPEPEPIAEPPIPTEPGETEDEADGDSEKQQPKPFAPPVVIIDAAQILGNGIKCDLGTIFRDHPHVAGAVVCLHKFMGCSPLAFFIGRPGLLEGEQFKNIMDDASLRKALPIVAGTLPPYLGVQPNKGYLCPGDLTEALAGLHRLVQEGYIYGPETRGNYPTRGIGEARGHNRTRLLKTIRDATARPWMKREGAENWQLRIWGEGGLGSSFSTPGMLCLDMPWADLWDVHGKLWEAGIITTVTGKGGLRFALPVKPITQDELDTIGRVLSEATSRQPPADVLRIMRIRKHEAWEAKYGNQHRTDQA